MFCSVLFHAATIVAQLKVPGVACVAVDREETGAAAGRRQGHRDDVPVNRGGYPVEQRGQEGGDAEKQVHRRTVAAAVADLTHSDLHLHVAVDRRRSDTIVSVATSTRAGKRQSPQRVRGKCSWTL